MLFIKTNIDGKTGKRYNGYKWVMICEMDIVEG